MAYRKNKMARTELRVNESAEGETIEQKVERILENSDEITDGAPIIYMERKDGVQPEYDIRTDRFEHAVDAMDYVQKSKLAKREERAAEREKIIQLKKDGEKGTESGGGKESEA